MMYTKTELGLPHTSPEQQGIASSAMLQFVAALESQIDEIHSFMLLRHGSIVAEGWWSPYGREHPHTLFSLSKSFTSTAVGLAVTEGHFSIDDPVLSFFSGEAPLEASSHLRAMRVRHLLSMSTGHADDTWPYLSSRDDGQWIKGFFEVPVTYAPGTHFLYNTGATYILSAIIQKTTGLNLVEYLKPRLFEPLGIEHVSWQESPEGITLGGIGLSLKTEDIAKFGQLYLQKGVWQGNRILPEAWVEEATTIQMSNKADPPSDWTQGYGYQFWLCRHGAYRGDGVFGQYCIVMPEQDAVLAITGAVGLFDMQPPLDLVWEILLPAMGVEAIADDPTSHNRLTEKLSSLFLPPVQGQATSPMASQVSDRIYTVDTNDLQIKTIGFSFTESGCTAHIKLASGEETIACGYDRWLPSQAALFNQNWLAGPTPIVASGAWTAEDAYTMVVRLYETPFYHTVVFHFGGDEMMLEAQVNVSFGSLNWLSLMAHSA